MDGRNHDNFFKTNALFILYIHVISQGDPMTTLLQIQEQCLKWTVAQSPNATNILFGRPKAAPN